MRDFGQVVLLCETTHWLGERGGGEGEGVDYSVATSAYTHIVLLCCCILLSAFWKQIIFTTSA